MDTTALLDQGFAWTAARIAAVPSDGLDLPTPCARWDLRELLDHTVETLTMFADAVGSPTTDADAATIALHPLGATHWDRAIAELAARSRLAWAAPGVMDRTIVISVGAMPAPMAAAANLLEVVTHGWDISQASGEAVAIPDALATPILEFARMAIGDARTTDHFAADLGLGTTPSEQLVAYLGRKPQ